MGVKPWVGKTVVIVEDSQSVQAELSKLYTDSGMKVVGRADNGVTALKVVNEVRPDLVSLDVVMPEMDGVECFYKLKEAGDTSKAFFVTWLATEAKALESLKKAVPEAEFIVKVPSMKALEDGLARVFDPSLRTVSNEESGNQDYLGALGVKSA